MKISAYGNTDIGKLRKRNEDAYLIDEENLIFIVADGAGGCPDGDLASRTAVNCFRNKIKELSNLNKRKARSSEYRTFIDLALIDTHKQMLKINPEMVTTISGLLIVGTCGLTFNIGDSPIYGIRNNNIYKLYKQHGCRNILYEHLGSRGFKNPYIRMFNNDLKPGDNFVICSDGLEKHVSEKEIVEINKNSSKKSFHQHLINTALERGGKDNITVITVHLYE